MLGTLLVGKKTVAWLVEIHKKNYPFLPNEHSFLEYPLPSSRIQHYSQNQKRDHNSILGWYTTITNHERFPAKQKILTHKFHFFLPFLPYMTILGSTRCHKMFARLFILVHGVNLTEMRKRNLTFLMLH